MKTFGMILNGLAAAALTLALVACGGGGGDAGGTAAPGDGGNGPAPGGGSSGTLVLSALGSSATTASLGWTRASGASGYTLQRQATGGAWMDVARLGPADSAFVDDGLAAGTTYTYRLAAQGAAAAPVEQSITTPAEPPMVTAAPTVRASAVATGDIGPAGGSVALADGSMRFSLPAGALEASAAVSLEVTSNPVQAGQGDGVRIRLAATPTQPVTLTFGYDAALDANADGLGIALQRADGSWLSVPVTALDKTARTLSAQIAPALLQRPAPATASRVQRSAAAPVPLELSAIRYLNLYLSPKQATLPTGGSQVFVPYAHTQIQTGHVCLPDEELGCLPSPLLTTREVPLLNQKAGYDRRWFVFAEEGGAPAIGTVTPRSASGAVYRAPDREPTPNPVIVSFRSQHLKSGRTITLSAPVTVREPVWTMVLGGVLEQRADIGFTYSAEAVWTRDTSASGGAAVYRANGTQSVHVINITCVATPSPATIPLPPGALTIDRSVQPARYTLDVGSFWETRLSGSCPDGSGSGIPARGGRQLVVQGTLSADGTRIDGSLFDAGVTWTWSLTNQL